MNAFASWWHGLAVRERVLLGVGGGALLATLYWLAVIEPYAEREARLTRRIAAEHETQQWLVAQQVPGGIDDTAPRERLPDGASLLAAVNESAATNGVAAMLTRVTPAGPRGASLNFSSVPYADFIRWLLAVDTRYGAKVERIRIERADAAGVVNVDLALSF